MPAQPHESSSPTSMPSKPAVRGRRAPRARGVHQPDLVRLRDHVGGMRRVLVVLGRARPDLALGEVPRQLAQRLLLVGQGERDARSDRLSIVATGSSSASIDSSVNSLRARLGPRNYPRRPVATATATRPARGGGRGDLPLRRPDSRARGSGARARAAAAAARAVPARGAPRDLGARVPGARRGPHGVPARADAARAGAAARPRPGQPAPRARAPFGEKSVVELPTYEPPDWVVDDGVAAGRRRASCRSGAGLRAAVDVLVWAPADADPGEPLPLLIAHDGPEYAEFSQLAALPRPRRRVRRAAAPRAALVRRRSTATRPTRRRRATRGRSRRSSCRGSTDALPTNGAPAGHGREPRRAGRAARALAARLRGGPVPPVGRASSGERVGQAGVRFGRFGADRALRRPRPARPGRAAPRVPVTITVGPCRGEPRQQPRGREGARSAQGWDVRLVEQRDAHNWVAWRDMLDPHLSELLLRAWT